MNNQPTVRVEPVEGHDDAYWVVWDKEIVDSDVFAAFDLLQCILNDADQPVNVLLDLRADPNMPVAITMESILDPYRHVMLNKWLIIGTNWRAEMIVSVLRKLAMRDSTLWFDTVEEALDELQRIEVVPVYFRPRVAHMVELD